LRKISSDALQPGWKVGRPIYDSEGRILLNVGVILTNRYIKRLKRLGIPAVYIDEGLLPDVQIDDVICEQTRLQAIKQVKEIYSEYSQRPDFQPRAIIKKAGVVSVINKIIDELLANRSLLVNLVDIRSFDEYTFGHSVNVCVLAALTGITMEFSRVKLFHLGMAALLHDIGKTFVPENILNKPGPLTEEEFEVVKKHSLHGYQVLSIDPSVSKVCAVVAVQHHERYNGQGYPYGLEKNGIHEFSRITGMVDMYDAITADRIYRKAYPPNEAYEMLAGSGDFLFDFNVVQAFLQNIAAYPIGTIVRLSTGEVGIVVETIKGFPLHPRVRILFSAQGEPVFGEVEIGLNEKQNITISSVIEDFDNPGFSRRQNQGT